MIVAPVQLANAKAVYRISNAHLYVCPRETDKGFQRDSMISLEHDCHRLKIVFYIQQRPPCSNIYKYLE